MYWFTIECISLVGTAAGMKKFEADAAEVNSLVYQLSKL